MGRSTRDENQICDSLGCVPDCCGRGITRDGAAGDCKTCIDAGCSFCESSNRCIDPSSSSSTCSGSLETKCEEDTVDVGAIEGSTVGVLVVVAIISVIIFCIFRSRARKKA